jgi:hypothetical protein
MMRDLLRPPSYNKDALPELIAAIEELGERIEERRRLDLLSDARQHADSRITELSEVIRRLTKKDIDIAIFEEYYEHSSAEEMAAAALIPEPPAVTDMSLEELVQVVKLFSQEDIIEGNYTDYYLKLLEKSFHLSEVSDYIFWPDQHGLNLDATEEEIAAKIYIDSKSR